MNDAEGGDDNSERVEPPFLRWLTTMKAFARD